jgi:NAD(P)-dependent dehydrogenase (short-subunit alcohol dehydrogenase family)
VARQPRNLTGKVVAVTGGARGIGRATAAALAREGAKVAIGDIDEELAARAAEELGGGCPGLPLDVTDRGSFESFLDTVAERLGPLDVLVNNAGILHLGPFLEEDDLSSRRMIDVNLIGVINGTRLAVPRLRPRPEGHLVNVASSAGHVSPPGIATYAATKHAVVGLTEAVRAENRDSRLEFSIVMPGVVKTEMIAGYAPPSWAAREIEPEDVAAAIVEAIRRPRVDVWVPRSLGAILRVMSMLPRRASEAIGRALGAERITWQADRSARAAYEARAAASDPGLEPGAGDGKAPAVVEPSEAEGLPGRSG